MWLENRSGCFTLTSVCSVQKRAVSTATVTSAVALSAGGSRQSRDLARQSSHHRRQRQHKKDKEREKPARDDPIQPESYGQRQRRRRWEYNSLMLLLIPRVAIEDILTKGIYLLAAPASSCTGKFNSSSHGSSLKFNKMRI